MDLFSNCQHCIISAGFICDEINVFLNRDNPSLCFYWVKRECAFGFHIIFSFIIVTSAIYFVAIDMFSCTCKVSLVKWKSA